MQYQDEIDKKPEMELCKQPDLLIYSQAALKAFQGAKVLSKLVLALFLRILYTPADRNRVTLMWVSGHIIIIIKSLAQATNTVEIPDTLLRSNCSVRYRGAWNRYLQSG